MLAAIKQLFKKEELPQPTTGEIGWENSNLYSSKDFPKYNPDDLIGRKGAGIYRKMMLDDQVTVGIFLILRKTKKPESLTQSMKRLPISLMV